MKTFHTRLCCGVACACALVGGPGTTSAETSAQGPAHTPAQTPAQTSVETSAPTTPSAAAQPRLFHSAPAVGDAELARRSGGSSSLSTQDVALAGRVAGNRAVNVSTGNNAIEGGSFSNAVGLSTVIQNSGANVLIQNATTVTVLLK